MRLIIFLSVLLLPIAAFARGDAPSKEFFTCTKSADCTVAEAVCPGSWIGVNKTQKNAYDKYTAARRALVECQEGNAEKPKRVMCKNKVCMPDIYEREPNDPTDIIELPE